MGTNNDGSGRAASNLVESYLGRMKQVVVLVDPYSTGCLVGQEISKRGYLLIRVWSAGLSDIMKGHQPASCRDLRYYDTVTVDDLIANNIDTSLSVLEATARAIRDAADGFPIVSILAGGDRGVDFADALSEHFGLLTNGTEIPNRRDKKVQQELVRAAGMRAVRQAGGDKFEDVEDFLKKEPYPVVVKPIESSGSDAVKLCQTYEEAKAHFELIMRTSMVDGGANTGVLVQEFLRGNEYIVDHVSRDGIHKTFMLFVYDKRPANGAPFVYYGCIPVQADSPEAKVLIPYVRGVLDAMGVKYGASHAEVMMTANGPCLVEMNCRCNGGDGIWRPLVAALTGGYTQVEGCADAYLDPVRFAQYPDKPPSPFRAAGCEIELVTYRRGVVQSTPGFTMISKLPSFVHLESGFKTGSNVEYTIDLDTCVGTVCLMHPDENVVRQDIQFIRYMEDIHGMFQFEPILENLKRPSGEAAARLSMAASKQKKSHKRVFSLAGQRGLIRYLSKRSYSEFNLSEADGDQKTGNVVVMVDPYSTGCCIAQEITRRGYKVVALWTDGFPEAMKRHFPISCGEVEYFCEVQEEATLDDTIKALREKTRNFKIVACLAGDDLGVDLADAVSEHLGLRTNGTEIRKTDKKIQQELVAKAGLRSIKQAGGSDFSDVALFLKSETFPVVLKPSRTAGSDGVKLCHDFESAKEYFEALKDSQIMRALEVPSIVVQEFLEGKEYILDHVSRDGEHKLMMIWSMDKQPANGSSHVYFGCVPEPCNSLDAEILIPYVRAVLNEVGVSNGPSHTQVVMTASGPCLIKVSCTARGGDGNWVSLSHALLGGYSQVEATVAAYLDKESFDRIPNIPVSPYNACGLELLLVSFSRGTVKATPGFDVIKQLASFVYLETGVECGSEVEYTIDLFTCVGSVILMHYDRKTLEHDAARIREMEENNALFEYDLEAGPLTLT